MAKEKIKVASKHEPIIIHNDVSIFVDVDDTLVLWDDEFMIPGRNKIALTDPYDDEQMIYLKPHTRHIMLIHEHFKKGYKVIVWSAAGTKWAAQVVERLDLSYMVSAIMTKPTKYLDDTPCTEWCGNQVYIKAK